MCSSDQLSSEQTFRLESVVAASFVHMQHAARPAPIAKAAQSPPKAASLCRYLAEAAIPAEVIQVMSLNTLKPDDSGSARSG